MKVLELHEINLYYIEETKDDYGSAVSTLVLLENEIPCNVAIRDMGVIVVNDKLTPMYQCRVLIGIDTLMTDLTDYSDKRLVVEFQGGQYEIDQVVTNDYGLDIDHHMLLGFKSGKVLNN